MNTPQAAVQKMVALVMHSSHAYASDSMHEAYHQNKMHIYTTAAQEHAVTIALE